MSETIDPDRKALEAAKKLLAAIPTGNERTDTFTPVISQLAAICERLVVQAKADRDQIGHLEAEVRKIRQELDDGIVAVAG